MSQQVELKPPKDDTELVIKNYRVISKKKKEFFLPMTTKNSPTRRDKDNLLPNS